MSEGGRLVYMANQIARNLAARGHERAVAEMADHLAAFWDVRMREQILAMEGVDLDEIAAEALDVLRTTGGARVSADPVSRPGGSDAG